MNTLTQTNYGLGTTASGSFAETIEVVKAAFKDQGFGLLTEIDMQATFEAKIGEHIEPYTVFGMCNPGLAFRAVGVEHEIGVLLPCNVLVHECGGTVHVLAQDPILMLQMSDNEALKPIAEEARRRIESALANISG